MVKLRLRVVFFDKSIFLYSELPFFNKKCDVLKGFL